MFGLIILTIAICASTVMTMRLIAPYPVSFIYKMITAMIVFFMWSAPFLANMRGREWHGFWFNLYTYAMYFLFVSAFLLFVALLVRDLIWILSYQLIPALSKNFPNLSPFNLTALFWANVGTVALVFALSGWALYNGVKVPDVEYLTISSDKIKEEKTIAVLSDLHLNRALSLQKLQGIVDKTNALKPDMIVLPGDIIDDDTVMLQKHLAILKNLQAPMGIFASHGNHEFYVGLAQSSAAFQQLGFTELTNDGAAVSPDLFIAGIPDHKSYERFTHQKIQLDQPLKKASPDQYIILLSHNPPFINQVKKEQIDLQISGHTHGGQIFPFHILVWLGNGYLSGLYQKTPAPLYITRGAGQWGPQMRLGADSEITFITLKPIH